MAAEAYLRDLSEYLTTGNLSDLTLTFGEKSWQIHKALACCHSKWFQKALTGRFEESSNGAVALHDGPEFADAVDCMVSYFYKAGYNASRYDAPEALLHAQVAAIADKYDCASLYKLATTSFANTINAVESEDWVTIAALIYDHTTTESPSHKELRGLLIAAVAHRPAVLDSILQMECAEELLRSNADLATDLLLSARAKDFTEHIFICDHCHYVHAGSPNCSYAGVDDVDLVRICSQCWKGAGTISKRYVHRVDLYQAFTCPSCDGMHTLVPTETGPEIEI